MFTYKSYVNHPDIFCYICGEYTYKENRKNVSDLVNRAYLGYFGAKLGDHDNTWAPNQVCKTCTEHLRQWTTGKRKVLNSAYRWFGENPKPLKRLLFLPRKCYWDQSKQP